MAFYTRLGMALAVVIFFCACSMQQSEALEFNWKSLPVVKEFLRSNPRARFIMTQGPFDDIIDLLIKILIRLIEEILGQPLRAQMGNLSDRLSLLERSTL